MKKFLGVLLVMLLMSVITGVVFAVVFDRLQTQASQPATVVEQPAMQPEPAPPSAVETRVVFEENSVGEVVQKIQGSVVIVRKEVAYFGNRQFVGTGSGVVYLEDDEAYYIITNAHVVEGGNLFNVGITDEELPAQLLGYDTDADIATLRLLKSDVPENLTIEPAPAGSSQNLHVGESVIAVGNALGYGQSVTKGIISAFNRDIQGLRNAAYRLIQTDAAINPGNSGGALVSADGSVVGINTVKIASTEVEGVGFAIPMEAAQMIAESIREHGFFPRAFLGVSVRDLDPYTLRANDFPLGVLVVTVVQGAPAQRAGIQEGDLITKIGEQDITTGDALVYEITSRGVGENVPITVYRNGETLVLTATLQSNEQFR